MDLTAADGEGFLDEYTLSLQHGSGAPVQLVPITADPALAGATLSGVAGALPGPTYGEAIAQGATRPRWYGGSMVFALPDAAALFPESCAYELILNVYKRNIVDCDEDDYYYGTAYYSFTVLFE